MKQRRRRSSADHFNFDAGGAEIGEYAAHQLRKLRQSPPPGFLHILDMTGVESDARERKVWQFLDDLGKMEQRLAGRNAYAAEPDIHFGQYADLHLRGARGLGKLARGD